MLLIKLWQWCRVQQTFDQPLIVLQRRPFAGRRWLETHL